MASLFFVFHHHANLALTDGAFSREPIEVILKEFVKFRVGPVSPFRGRRKSENSLITLGLLPPSVREPGPPGINNRFDVGLVLDAAHLKAIFLVQKVDRAVLAEPVETGFSQKLRCSAAKLEKFGTKFQTGLARRAWSRDPDLLSLLAENRPHREQFACSFSSRGAEATLFNRTRRGRLLSATKKEPFRPACVEVAFSCLGELVAEGAQRFRWDRLQFAI